MSGGRRAGLAALTVITLVTLFAPAIVPYDPARQFADFPFAPPMLPHVRAADGWHPPFVHPIRVVNRLEREYGVDTHTRMPICWFAHGRLLTIDAGPSPWFLLGSDGLGRDVLSRVLLGARLSLGVSAGATALALLIGALIGAWAGLARGWMDELLMRTADFVLVLPAIYVVLALRAALPLVLSIPQVFTALVIVLGLVGWPAVARGVRAIVAAEASQEYAEAARAAGATPLRILQHHLLPAARGFLFVQACVLVPAFVLAEATLSFVGLGFAAPAASWGAMLQDAASVRTLAEAPWLLAPAAAIVATVLAVHLAAATAPEPWLWKRESR